MDKNIKAGSPKAARTETAFKKGPPPRGTSAPVVATGRTPWGTVGYLAGAAAVLGIAIVGIVFLPNWLFPPKPRIEAALQKEEDEDDRKTPPKLNANKPPGPAPDGMVWIPGGEFYMGCDEANNRAQFVFPDAVPVHKVYVDGFWMDKVEVTNEAFAKFVDATGYKTIAERPPNPKDFPGVPAEKLKDPFSIVFKQPGPNDEIDLRRHLGWWDMVKGASWKHPEGPGSDLKGKEKHPVAHIAWDDAVAYCKWANKRLPTEAEWEFAARGGLDQKLYCWGDDLTPDGKWQCNIWQGDFPRTNDLLDGHMTTAPVASFPANGYGLYDMAGNVWEWCQDYYQPNYYEKSPMRNPQGPISGFDPQEPGTQKRVQRGGSFLCCDNYCIRYLPGARGKGEPSSAASHVGFRCVKDP